MFAESMNRSSAFKRFVAEQNSPVMVWGSGVLIFVYGIFFYGHHFRYLMHHNFSPEAYHVLSVVYLIILFVVAVVFVLSIVIRRNFTKLWKLHNGLVIFMFLFLQFIGLVEIYCSIRVNNVNYFFWLIVTLICLGMLYVPPSVFGAGMAAMAVFSYKLMVPIVGAHWWGYMAALIIVFAVLNISRFYGVFAFFQQTREIALQRERADYAVHAKSAFLANMSHEIRTPINAVLGMGELILRESTDDQITEYAYSIKESGKTLLSLINDILDFTRIESGKMEIISAEYEISSTLNALIDLVSTRMKEKGLELRLDISPSIPHILYGDEIRIRQAVSNLLTNAVKYTERGSITFSVTWEKISETRIELVFAVADTGIGIKPDDIERIYIQFERLDELRNRNIEGTGLGLSIAKSLVDLMDGTFSVKSEYGRGSVFTLRIPQQILTSEPVGDFRRRYRDMLRVSGRAIKSPGSFIAPECRILVVDDNDINLKVIEGLLKTYDLQIVVASNGENALKTIDAAYSRNICFDLILMDHLMPHMNGIETTACIRQKRDTYFKNLPILALTATAFQDAREMFISSGMQDFIAKPVDVRTLEDMLLKWLPSDKVVMRE